MVDRGLNETFGNGHGSSCAIDLRFELVEKVQQCRLNGVNGVVGSFGNGWIGLGQVAKPTPIIDTHIHIFDPNRPQGAPYKGPNGSETNKTGAFPMYCTEFCSALHLEMMGYFMVKPKGL